jgi:L,D-transpeptidase-like protein
MRRVLAALFVLTLAATPGTAKVLIEIDKSSQLMRVSVDGAALYRWPVSTGRAKRDTPAGSFRAFRMERDHFSKEWDDAPMPHSIFFTRAGHAIHGSYEVRKIGTPASAGCVRLHPENAAQLFALVEQQGVLNTTVVVSGDLIARRRLPRPQHEDDDAPTYAPPGYYQPRGYYEPPPRYEPRQYEYPQPRVFPFFR